MIDKSSPRLVVHLKIDPYDVNVGRPSKWGNPYTVEMYGRGVALEMYNEWIWLPGMKWLRNEMRIELRGKILGCWCAKKGGLHHNASERKCHAQTIAFIANETEYEL